MTQKIFVSRAFCGICTLLILTNLSGCYSNLPIEMGKVNGTVEVSKIKLKDKTEVRFNTGENQLLTITNDHLIYLDSGGITRKIYFSEVEKFYAYRVDSGKIIFGALWTVFGLVLLQMLFGPRISLGG